MGQVEKNNPFENNNLPRRVSIPIGKLIEKYKNKPLASDAINKEHQNLKKELGLKANEDLIVLVDAVIAGGSGNKIGLNESHLEALRVAFNLPISMYDLFFPKIPFYATIEGTTSTGQPTDPIEVIIKHIKNTRGNTPNQIATTDDVAKKIDINGGVKIVEIFQRLADIDLGDN